ncbi:MAG: polyprenyl synthetase family protein [Gammaproteobacteria bacterium]
MNYKLNAVAAPVIAQIKDELENELANWRFAANAETNAICHYTLPGGKRLRPTMLLITARALNLRNNLCNQLAMAVELLHNATLIHDDILDDADLRHDRPSVSKQCGQNSGLLAGDMLYAHTFKLISTIENTELRLELAETACALTEAEFSQLEQKDYWQSNHYSDIDTLWDESVYFNIIKGKTARLFRFCCLAPALLARAPTEIQDALAYYGEQFGLAFQLVDDALDCAPEKNKLGKQAGIDLKEGIITLPLARALQVSHADGRKAIQTALHSSSPTDAQIAVALQAIHATDAYQYTIESAKRCANTALEALQALPDNEYTGILATMVQDIATRAS